jgi:hypothetical protein
MSLKIKPSIAAEIKKPKSEKGKILILIDCVIPIKLGSEKYVHFNEGDIIDFYKITKVKIQPCCGAQNAYQYYYTIKDNNVNIPIQLAKEL